MAMGQHKIQDSSDKENYTHAEKQRGTLRKTGEGREGGSTQSKNHKLQRTLRRSKRVRGNWTEIRIITYMLGLRKKS